MADNFVTFCAACTSTIPIDEIKYSDGRIFHAECLAKHADGFQAPDPEIAKQSLMLKIQIIQLQSQLGKIQGKVQSRRKTARKSKSRKTLKKKSTRKKTRRTVKARRKKTVKRKKTARKAPKKRAGKRR